MQKANPLRLDLSAQEIDTSCVTFGPTKACNQTKLYWVASDDEHDWNCGRRGFCSQSGRIRVISRPGDGLVPFVPEVRSAGHIGAGPVSRKAREDTSQHWTFRLEDIFHHSARLTASIGHAGGLNSMSITWFERRGCGPSERVTCSKLAVIAAKSLL